MRKKQVLVIGGSDEHRYSDESYHLGRFIALSGWVLITGGRGGIMEAVSKGAESAGGIVVGILPGDDFSGANGHCTVVIPTGIGFARNAVNVLSADVIVAIGGKAGTLSELAYAWMYGKPVICCTFAEGWSSMFPRVRIDDRDGAAVHAASSVEEACSLLERLCAG
jgi:uncharacterized protein (TIGR00725 family)